MTSSHLKLAVASALLGLCSLAACAQSTDQQTTPQTMPEGSGHGHGQWRGQHGPERELAMLTQRLNLTADQQTGVKAILDQQRSQVMALRGNGQTQGATADTPEARQARTTQMNQIRDDSDNKIAALLDDNQKKTFAGLVARRKAAMARRQSEGAGAPPPPPAEN